MGNRYSSNIRTYTARNLVWDTSASQPIPFLMAAPTALTIQGSSMLQVFYKAQIPADTGVSADWNRESRIAVKRAGVFCNFADGLVQKMDTSRISMSIIVGIYDKAEQDNSAATFTVGSNEVTGPSLNILQAGAVLLDTTSNYPYFIAEAAASAGDPLYLTDYARVSNTVPKLVTMNPDSSLGKLFNISNLATLNTMYETEIFYPSVPLTADQRLYISCQLSIDGNDSSLDFYTKTVDTAFNGSPVSFDSVIELEVTPA